MIIKCPSCNKVLNTTLAHNFYYCRKCEIAVRSEDRMPLPDKDIYKKDWVSSQIKTRYLLYRAQFVLQQIKKIGSVNRVLDIACGIGVLVNLMNLKNFKADGIDSSPEAVNYARIHNKGNFYLNSIDNFNPDCRYDCITATQIIEHLRTPDKFLKELHKFLKPGGYLYIETPNLNSYNKDSIWRKRVGGIQGRDHRIVYTLKSLSELVERNGFIVGNILTKTYPSKIFTACLDSVYFDFYKRKKPAKPEKGPGYKNNIKRKRSLLKKILLRIYNWVIYSIFLEILFYLPDKISEFKGKGVQIVLIAQKEK